MSTGPNAVSPCAAFPRSVVPFLCCPVCRSRVGLEQSALACTRGHAFDIARQGYVNLLVGNAAPANADGAAMIEARHRFLAAGHYAPLATLVADIAAGTLGSGPERGCVLEVGAGTGYYLTRAIERRERATGVALDVSRYAARRAARAHPRIGAVVADAWRPLPLQDGSAALALSVFAPRNARELNRVLVPGGAVLVVTPTPRHLNELIAPLGMLRVEEDKQDRVRARLSPHFRTTFERTLELKLRLEAEDITDAVAMGPTAFHVPRPELERRAAALAAPLGVTASFSISVLRQVATGAP